VPVAVVLVFLILPVLPIGDWGRSNAAGTTLLAQSVQAISNVQTVHMMGRMRTLPGDNFELIGTNNGFVPLHARFVLTIVPSNVIWGVHAVNIKPVPAEINRPNEAESYFFDVLAHEDWDALMQVLPVSRVSDEIKRDFGGLEVVPIGEPFRSGFYPGYFVPYEVRLRDGATKKWKLAVRNDNPSSHRVVDGGF